MYEMAHMDKEAILPQMILFKIVHQTVSFFYIQCMITVIVHLQIIQEKLLKVNIEQNFLLGYKWYILSSKKNIIGSKDLNNLSLFHTPTTLWCKFLKNDIIMALFSVTDYADWLQ